MPTYSLYVLRCRDDSLYTGIATDVARRLAEHADGRRGARYLRGRGPVRLLRAEPVGDRSAASRAEASFKRLSKSEKERLVVDADALKAHIADALARSDGD
ncbi:MAG: GIY-YIG nuclease family protein [Woeseiaceae bacterium]|nr:GIY-YIG nuclease family protein [Woeseiaceae bacterium]